MSWKDQVEKIGDGAGIECACCRRDVLAGAGAALSAGLAGCTGGSDDVDEDELQDEIATFPDFDPDNPEFPQTTETLLDAGFERGTVDWIENQEERDRTDVPHGDPVPEVPAPEDEWIEPDPLIVSRGPSEDQPEAYADAFGSIQDNIEEELDVDTEYYQMTDHSAGIEAMRSERLHLTSMSTGNVPFMVNVAGGIPLAVGIGDDESFGYRLWVITPTLGGIDEPEEMEGETIPHTSEGSNSGHQAPSGLFGEEFGVVPGEDYEIEWSGGHDATSRGIFMEDWIAGPICSSCYMRAVEESGDDTRQMKVVYSSDPFPSGPLSYLYNLHPDYIEAIRTALLDYDYSGTRYEEELGAERFVEIDYATHWNMIMTIQSGNDVDYGEEL